MGLTMAYTGNSRRVDTVGMSNASMVSTSPTTGVTTALC